MKIQLNKDYQPLKLELEESMELYHPSEDCLNFDILLAIKTQDYSDKCKKICVASNKEFLRKNVPYFGAKFNPDSNWKDTGSKRTKTGLVIIEEEWENPQIFADYLRALNEKVLDVNQNNCAQLYSLLDYLSEDKKILDKIRMKKKNWLPNHFF